MSEEDIPGGATSPQRKRGFGWRRALSELAIIVVGVLIALAVNNWTQSQRDHAVEAHYLERLLADSSENLAMIQERINLHTRRADTLVRLSAWLRDGTPRPTDAEVSEVLCRWFIQPALRLRRETYAELVSTGHLALLGDVGLRSLLEQAEARHEEALVLDRFNDILQRVTAPLDRYRQWQIDPGSGNHVSCQFDFEGMRSEPVMPSMFAQIYRDETLNRSFRERELTAVRGLHACIVSVRSKP